MRSSTTLLHRLYLWHRDHPEQAAHFFRDRSDHWQSISVELFWEQVLRIALYLQSRGITKSSDRVVVYAFNSPEWVQWELGIWLAGAMSVGIHPSTHLNDLTTMVALAKPKLVVAESKLFLDRLLQSQPADQTSFEVKTFKEMSDLLMETALPENLHPISEKLLAQIDENRAQIMVFTAGSLGSPKGVKLGLKQLTFVADCLAREWNLPFGDGTLYSFLPLSHIAEKLQTLSVAVSQRYTVWFSSKYERLHEELREVRPTLFCAVPRVWERMKEQVENNRPKLLKRVMEFERFGGMAEKLYLSQVKEKLGFDRLQLAVSGAAKLSAPVGEWFEKVGLEVQEIYGMSEACGLITLTNRKRDSNFEYVGSPPSGIEVDVNLAGEISVRGDHVFFGYEDDEAETNAILSKDGWLKTGDLGEWIEINGERVLHILGRNREIIKLSNGKMIAPGPIENALKEIPEVSNACVVGESRAHLMAFLTLQEKVLMEYKFVPGAVEGLAVEDEALKKKIRNALEELFQNGKLPDRIHHFVILSRDFSVDQKELTPTQKINRAQVERNLQYFIQLAFEEN